MKLFLFGCLFAAAVSLLAGCSSGGGGGSTVPLKLDGLSVYDYQTASSSQKPVLQDASYPAEWDKSGKVTPPKVSPLESVYSDGTKVIRDGSVNKPFLQSELATAKIQDPNAVVRSVSELAAVSTLIGYRAIDYDLRWGTPDTMGPSYAQRYANGTWQPEQPLKFWGQTLTGLTGRCGFILTGTPCVSDTGPSLAAPAQDVLDAWNLGWTGKDVNILMEDFLYDKVDFHGTITSLIAYRYAPGAKLYGLNFGADQSSHSVVNLANETYQGAPIKLGVVNASYVANLEFLTGKKTGWTQAELDQARIDNTYNSLLVTNRFQNASYKGQVNYTDAVITKAAGNDALRSDQEPINKALADISTINSRLLIVGGLTQAGTTDNPVEIAYYSNTAGKDAAVSSRYLLASGTVPFESGGLVVNGTTVQANSNMGTSYAAPRVAGMVAIVRSKFPNLNASQTASIMLDTARYDTLACYYTAGGCDKTIYGRGEASLSRALAPVGRLR